MFKPISEATSDVNILDNHDEKAPVHILAKAPHSTKIVREALHILLSHRPPADINLPNGRGETALFIALGNTNFDTGHEQRAFSFVDSGAHLLTRTKDGKDILCSVAENTTLQDDDSLRLIRLLLSRISGTNDDTSIHCTYAHQFLPHRSSILTLSAAASSGRLETTKFLLDLGLRKHINHPYQPPSDDAYSPDPFRRTVLDTALAAALSSRQNHLDRLAAFEPGPGREHALKSNSIYDNSPSPSSQERENPRRVEEAHASFPSILNVLRDHGAKRACELDPVPDPSMLDIDYLSKLRPRGDASHPDLWDIKSMYALGYTWATLPDRQQWCVVYELARRLGDWRETLVGELRWMYEEGLWRPHLQMLKDVVGMVKVKRCDRDISVGAAKPSGCDGDGAVQVPDVEFLRKILAMLSTVNKPEETSDRLEIPSRDGEQQKASSVSAYWVEVTETQKHSRPSALSVSHILEVELANVNGEWGLGRTRRKPRDILD